MDSLIQILLFQIVFIPESSRFPAMLKKKHYARTTSLAEGLKKDEYVNQTVWDSLCLMFMDTLEFMHELISDSWLAEYKEKDIIVKREGWDDIHQCAVRLTSILTVHSLH
jgi:hypothetical protein